MFTGPWSISRYYGDPTCFPYEAGLHHLLDLEFQEKQPPVYGIQQNYFHTVAHIWPVFTPSSKLQLDMVVIPKLRLPVASIGRLGNLLLATSDERIAAPPAVVIVAGGGEGTKIPNLILIGCGDFLRYEKGLRTVYQNSQSDIIS